MAVLANHDERGVLPEVGPIGVELRAAGGELERAVGGDLDLTVVEIEKRRGR